MLGGGLKQTQKGQFLPPHHKGRNNPERTPFLAEPEGQTLWSTEPLPALKISQQLLFILSIKHVPVHAAEHII